MVYTTTYGRALGYTSSDYGNKRTKRMRGASYRRPPQAARFQTTYNRRRAYNATVAPETKYFDCGINTAVTWAGSTWASSEVPCDNYVNASGAAAAYTDSALIPSAVGSGYGQINGNRYKIKKIRVRGRLRAGVTMDQADASPAVFARAMLIMDTQPNGAQAQGEDIFQDIGEAGENIFSFKRVATTSGRFRVLKDDFLTLDATNSQTDGTNTASVGYADACFTWQYQPKMPIQVNVKSGNATPTVAGLVDCNIFMLVAAVRAGSAIAINVTGASRCYYVD